MFFKHWSKDPWCNESQAVTLLKVCRIQLPDIISGYADSDLVFVHGYAFLKPIQYLVSKNKLFTL